jgi:hypothetical protein
VSSAGPCSSDTVAAAGPWALPAAAVVAPEDADDEALADEDVVEDPSLDVADCTEMSAPCAAAVAAWTAPEGSNTACCFVNI